MRRALLIGLCLLTFTVGKAQCPVASFNAPPTGCLGESLFTANTSSSATSYQWDFCSGDLGGTPTASVAAIDASLFRARTFRIVWSGISWIGFAVDQNSFLVRMDFGADPRGTPSVTTVGNPGSLIGLAFDIATWQEGTSWYAMIANTSGDNLLLLSFGTNILSTPTVTNLGSLGGVLKGPAGIQFVKNGASLYALVTNSTAPEVVRLSFGSSIVNAPTTSVIPLAGATALRGVAVGSECDHEFALVTDNGGNKIYYLDFPGIQNAPTTGVLSIPGSSYSFPTGIVIRNEGAEYFAFIQSGFPSNLYRVNFGNSMLDLTGTFTDLGNLNINGAGPGSQFNAAMELVQQGSVWTAFSVDLSDPDGKGRLLRIAFPNLCASPQPLSSSSSPVITYNTAGTYRVSLQAYASNGSVAVVAQNVTISALAAPDIDFIPLYNCAGSPIQFTSFNSSGNLVGYAWSFGDTFSSGSVNPSHTYASAGTFFPRLTVTASNGCTNTVERSIDVYTPPVANFTLPVVAPVCTNQPYAFVNTSTADPAASPVWEWRVNGILVDTQQNLTHAFTNPVAHEIRLKALIPGCENEMVRNIATVLAGPVVDFAGADDCAGSAVAFANTTTGADAGYSWNFGDGSPPSTQAQPSHTFTGAGTFSVTLTGSNAAGCNNFITKSITIYAVPQPDFSVGLPPFSCSNSPTLFQNDTPALTDSNISDWLWEFGDPASSASANRDPTFVYAGGGNYSVTLTATSDAGCSNVLTKLVSIGSSPMADFANGPACVNRATQFSDLSSGGVQSRTWQIGGSFFGGANPTYTFAAPGTYNVTLTVTGSGGCNNAITKPVTVPVVPTLVMQAENPCVNQQATFTLVNTTLPPFLDDVIGWQWNIAGSAVTGNPATGAVSVLGSSPVSVTTTHASGCVYVQTNNVFFNPSPVADFTASPDRGNAPLTVQFQNLSSGASQYQWQFTGNPPGFSTEASPIHTFLELGDYTAQLTVVNAQGCSDSKAVPIQVLVPAIDLVLTQFSLLPDGLTGKLRPAVTVQNNSNIPVFTVEVAIHLSDRATVTESLAVNLGAGESVSRTLSLTVDPEAFPASYVCAEVLSEKDVVIADNRRCINFDERDFVFDPYPNPSAGLLYLDWVSEKPGTTGITVYNGQGRVEYQWQTPSVSGLNQSVHDLSFLASGIYFVRVQTSTTVQTRRFVRP